MSHQENPTTVEKQIEETQGIDAPQLNDGTPTPTPTATTNYSSVDNEIWASITPQQDASLRALHQSMQSNSNTTDNTNNNALPASNTTTAAAAAASSKKPEDSDDKPAVGSEEWHRLRRENHKQVERRRRETINDGITELSRIVPGCEKNKGSILQRAAIYIRQLKEAEAATVEKWTLEKLLTDQAISELNRQVEALKNENDRILLQNEYLKRELENATGNQHLHQPSNNESTVASKKQKLNHQD
ncbi:uncharacterized protein ATC70_010862 [Mucor velutinosus]|uniref:BHLH domain-containing protein n=2 Tax=Mucor TaxID=4830 RepID=A0AAN7DFS3_9FUNG|nr:hypothetical protein ATC70_010862 [Mucor velutinosus]